MVIGIATGLLGLGLALPTGLAFGYGYGYGVRQGYSAFKQPSAGIQGLKMSPDPIQGSLGMGLQTAEERTSKTILPPPVGPKLSSGQSLQKQDRVINPTNRVRDRETFYKNKRLQERNRVPSNYKKRFRRGR